MKKTVLVLMAVLFAAVATMLVVSCDDGGGTKAIRLVAQALPEE